MSFAETLSEIPRLSFAEPQEWVRSAIALDNAELTAEENAPLDARREDFRRQPDAGIPLEERRPACALRATIHSSAASRMMQASRLPTSTAGVLRRALCHLGPADYFNHYPNK